MNAHTVWWLTCLALIKNFACLPDNPFVLEKLELTATEGSCIEIKCKEKETSWSSHAGDYWYWMKDSSWNNSSMSFNGTIVYSTYEKRPVSSLFKERVSYINDTSKSGAERLCHILICKLTKADSGNYSFRFEGKDGKKWKTEPEANLTIVENPCPITFEKPPDVMENNTVMLTCSTLKSCSSNLEIDPLMESKTTAPITTNSLETSENASKSITYSFKTSWMDDQTNFSCKTSDNKDKYLVKNVTITVKYAPRDVLAEKSSEKVKEGDPVTLTCSAKGQPNVTFIWFKNDEYLSISGSEMKFTSAEDSHSGLYYCEAKNDHGNGKSNKLNITVEYVPEVNVQVQPVFINEGDRVSLVCNVKRSQPPPHKFVWFKDEKRVEENENQIYNFTNIQPEHSGNYRCRATNTVGSGTSTFSYLRVHYKPRSSVSIIGTDDKYEVSVNSEITFNCSTMAYPDPWYYSWFRNSQSNPSQSIQNNNQREFSLKSVQRADEACYTCNASNNIGQGKSSEPKCIRVRYPPTNLMLSMDTTVTEGSSITITCSAESFPPSTFTLKRSNFESPKQEVIIVSKSPNLLSHSFTVTPAHAGSYICIASNRENTTESQERKLVVEYAPKNVRVSSPEVVVKENDSISLRCDADSNPTPKLFTWTKNSDKTFNKRTQSFIIVSASPSDSGLYSCTAENKVGSGSSQKVKVIVKYAPKQTTIIREGDGQLSNGMSFVKLRCKSTCDPPATYVWYRVPNVDVLKAETITVYSDKAGEYYCVAKNEMGEKSSDLIVPFDGSVKRIVLVVFISCIFILFLIILYRRKRKRSVQQRTANTRPCGDFLTLIQAWTRGRRVNTANEMSLVGPSRSRDDLLPDQPCHPNARRHQPRPDVSSASNINTVYCTVVPHEKQAASAQKPARQQDGHKEDDSLNYASLHFQKKQGKPEDVIYSKVSKPKPSKEKEEGLRDYENVSALNAVKPFNFHESESDSDTSEDEEEVSYTQVNIRQQRPKRNSSSSEEQTEYSLVKI